MKTTTQTLQNDVEKLKTLLVSERYSSAQKDSEIKKLQEKNQYLLELFRLAQQKRFGQSSEAHPGQGELFNEVEQLQDEVTEPEKESISDTRQKPKRKPLPKDLPRETVIIDLADEDKSCECCGHDLHPMGEKRSEQLEFIPAQIKVIETIRPQYSCRHCEKTATKVKIKIAPVPLSPIPKSMATASLLTQIITSKFQFSLPLYRQEVMFKQHGIALNRKTMSDWLMKSSRLFEPIVEYLYQQLLKQPVVQADETTLKVLHEDKAKCYMWVYCSGTDSPSENPSPIKNIVLYDYQPSRAGQCAVDYLEGFKGYLQADGYQGYEQVDTTLIGCMAHARRKFIEAKTAQPKNKTGRADMAIKKINNLYGIEKAIKGLPANEKYAIRQEKAKPLLKDLKQWLNKSSQQVLPKSAIGKAIQYSLNQWDKLSGYIKSGDINIDNNRAERAIKPFVIGRKNWMFCNTASGANSSAILYSLIETAKANGLTPFNYLMFLLQELPKQPDNLEPLMPWNVQLEVVI